MLKDKAVSPTKGRMRVGVYTVGFFHVWYLLYNKNVFFNRFGVVRTENGALERCLKVAERVLAYENRKTESDVGQISGIDGD